MSQHLSKLTMNINYLMGIHSIANVTELSKILDIPQPTMYRLLTGEVKDPKYITLKRIADHFTISVPDLVDNDLRSLKNKKISYNNNVDGNPEFLNFSQVPVIGGAQLGEGGHWANLQYPVGYGDGYINWPSKDPEVFALRCVGNSMTPRIKNGEYVIIEPNHGYVPGDEVLVVTRDEQVMVKTFLYERDGEIMVMSVNEEHLPLHFRLEEIEQIQYVAGIAKSSLYCTG